MSVITQGVSVWSIYISLLQLCARVPDRKFSQFPEFCPAF
jgi:hypothetical protein